MYAVARPTYPSALFDLLSSLTKKHERAWDVGTGNGQAAIGVTTFLPTQFRHQSRKIRSISKTRSDTIFYQLANHYDQIITVEGLLGLLLSLSAVNTARSRGVELVNEHLEHALRVAWGFPVDQVQTITFPLQLRIGCPRLTTSCTN